MIKTRRKIKSAWKKNPSPGKARAYKHFISENKREKIH